jgi:hypothetical protein
MLDALLERQVRSAANDEVPAAAFLVQARSLSVTQSDLKAAAQREVDCS